jgi:transcriptional regulator with XRE-family HTH domain/cation transport regulator ChaB
MPIALDKAPRTLPKAARSLWVDTFNGALEDCEGTTAECDERAAKIAWDQIKGNYRKVKDKWIAKSEYEDSYHDVMLTITKASLQPDGSVRWQAVASDTGKDRAEERTSVELFQDWIDRVTYKADVGYLPAAKMPFLGVSHYPALDGFGEAGVTRRMFIDGNVFKADGVFNNADGAIGQKLLDAVKIELALVKKGQHPDKPIRISAGWWDIEHYHEDSNFLFTRQALTDKCPLCEKGQTADKIYKAGQLDHFAATRVPMNPRTSLGLEEKSMSKITRREDAESIIGPDEAEEMERRARMVGKSDTEGGGELHPAMVTRATKIGSFIKRKREALEMSMEDLAAKTPVTASTIGAIEAGEHLPPTKLLTAVGKAIKVPVADLMAMLPEKTAKAMVTKATKLGDFIKRKREAKEMTIAQLAAETPVTAATIGDLERGAIAKPSKRDLSALATALDVDEDEISALAPDEADTTKAGDMLPGEFLKNIRRKKKKAHGDVEKRAGFKRGRLKRIEDDEDDIDFETMAGIADALDMDDEEMEDMGQRFGKKRKAQHEDDEDEDTKTPAKGSKKEQLLARFGNKRRKMPPKHKSDYGNETMMIQMPFGGATSMKEAQDYIDTKEKFGKLHSFWEIFETVVRNIMMADDEAIPDKVKAMSQAVKDLGGQIDTLKAGLSDAFLIQESTAAYEDYEAAEDIEYSEDNEVDIMTQEMITDHPADQLKAAVDAALENKSLSGADREAAVQEAFNEFAQGVQAQLVEADPASQADQIAGAIKGALVDVLTPLTEQMALMTAKMGNPTATPPQPQGVTPLQEVYVPQQKSMMAPPVAPQPVQPMPGMPVSPVTGKPSSLTAKIRKSVGLVV